MCPILLPGCFGGALSNVVTFAAFAAVVALLLELELDAANVDRATF